MKTLDEIKNELKTIDKETIIEMFYSMSLKLVRVENKLDEIKDILYIDEQY